MGVGTIQGENTDPLFPVKQTQPCEVLEWILASLSYVQKLAGMVRVYPIEQVLHCIWSVL